MKGTSSLLHDHLSLALALSHTLSVPLLFVFPPLSFPGRRRDSLFIDVLIDAYHSQNGYVGGSAAAGRSSFFLYTDTNLGAPKESIKNC